MNRKRTRQVWRRPRFLGIGVAWCLLLFPFTAPAIQKADVLAYYSFDKVGKPDFTCSESVSGYVPYARQPGQFGAATRLGEGTGLTTTIAPDMKVRWFAIAFWVKPLTRPEEGRPFAPVIYCEDFAFRIEQLAGDAQMWFGSVKPDADAFWPPAYFPLRSDAYEWRYAEELRAPNLRPGEWHHLAVNVGPNGAEYFFEGKRIGGHDGVLRPERPITKLSFAAGTQEAVIDDLYVFDRPISEQEAALLAGLGSAEAEARTTGLSLPQAKLSPVPGAPFKARYDILGQRIVIDARTLPDAGLPLAAFELLDHRETAVAATADLAVPDRWTQFILPLQEVPVGMYRLRSVRRTATDAAPVELADEPFEKVTDDTWEDAHALGRSRRVVKFFDPIAYDAPRRTARISLREVVFADTALPKQVVARGEPLLAAPVTLAATTDGTRTVAEGSDWEMRTARDDRLEVAATLSFGALRGSIETSLDPDGFTWCEVRIDPAPGRVLDELVIDVPLARTQARALYADHWVPNPQQAFSVLMQELAEQVDLAGGSDGELWRGPFLPFVWVGNVRRGLAWMTDSEQGVPDPRERGVITLAGTGEQAVLRIRLAGGAALDQPLVRRFALMATPVKRVPADMAAECRFTLGRTTGVGRVAFVNAPWWATYFSDPLVPDTQGFRREVRELRRERGLEFLPYFNATSLATGSWTPLYLEEAATVPFQPIPPDNMTQHGGAHLKTSLAGDKAQDFLVWCAKFMVEYYGCVGIYLDNDLPVQDANPHLGLGFEDAGGNRVGTYPLLGHRALHRRIRVMYDEMEEKLGRRLLLVPHGTIAGMSGFSFVDAYLDGERFRHIEQHDYIGTIDQQMVSIQFSPYAHGIPVAFLPQIKKSPEAMATTAATENALALMAVNGIPVWQGFCRYDAVIEYWERLDEFGVADADFIPYWDMQETPPGGEGLKIAAYVKPDAVLYVIGNFSKDAFGGRCELPGDRLPIGARQGRELRSGQVVEIDNGAATLNIPPRNYVLLSCDGGNPGGDGTMQHAPREHP